VDAVTPTPRNHGAPQGAPQASRERDKKEADGNAGQSVR
jgi:hypothetical protein